MSYLRDAVDPTIVLPENVVVGPLQLDQLKAGSVSLLDAGQPRMENFPGLVWVRGQIRILSRTLEEVDLIGRHLWGLLAHKNRIVARQTSNNSDYLIHIITVAAGPSQHYDSPITYEELMFTEMMVSTEAVAVA